jgi:hypothetical protein
MHFFIVKALERLVELAGTGRARAPLVKRCQQSLGESAQRAAFRSSLCV